MPPPPVCADAFRIGEALFSGYADKKGLDRHALGECRILDTVVHGRPPGRVAVGVDPLQRQ